MLLCLKKKLLFHSDFFFTIFSLIMEKNQIISIEEFKITEKIVYFNNDVKKNDNRLK